MSVDILKEERIANIISDQVQNFWTYSCRTLGNLCERYPGASSPVGTFFS
jgi:hypothetical protein